MHDQRWAVYEITLHGAPPVGLTARFPSLTLFSVPEATVLARRVVDPAEIDGLIDNCAQSESPSGMHASPPYANSA